MIIKIPEKIELAKKKNVAAYARVSNGKDAMLKSLSAQVSYYSKLIQSNNEWLYAGVYADEAFTGTKENRPEFQRLIADCKKGKVDMIITKSISRFARNSVTLLKIVRELRFIGVDVYFEEQNIHSLSSDGELMLSILVSYSQEESLSVSENQKWRVKRNFENGLTWGAFYFYGYDKKGNNLYVIPEEAEVIKLMVKFFLSGLGKRSIGKKLNELGYRTRAGNLWNDSSILCILTNYNYTGNLILQKTYRENHITKKTKVNNGVLPKYHVEKNHEAIIPLETFNAIQEEFKRRRDHIKKNPTPLNSPFKGILICGNCGKNYLRKKTPYKWIWICRVYANEGVKACESKRITEDELIRLTNEVIGDYNKAPMMLKCIKVYKDNRLVFIMKNNTEVTKYWIEHSRSESWTEEKRELARQRELSRKRGNQWQKLQ